MWNIYIYAAIVFVTKMDLLSTERLDHLVGHNYAITFYGIRSYSSLCIRISVTCVTPKSLRGHVRIVASLHAKTV